MAFTSLEKWRAKMKPAIPRNINDDLDFSIHEMLNLASDEKLELAEISKTTTAYTIRVAAAGERQLRYFIKTSRKNADSDLEKRLGKKEVDFYRFIDDQIVETYPNVPKCIRYHSVSEGHQYYLVLEDLSENFVSFDQVDFKDIDNWRCAVHALAHLHGLFYNRLPDESVDLQLNREDREDDNLRLRESYNSFREYCGDRISKESYEILEKSIPVMRSLEAELKQNLKEKRNITLVHGDAHNRNFLYPKDPNDIACIIDWQFWHFGCGTYDLRHLLGLGLKNEMRKHQNELVRYYHELITKNVNIDYSWNDCWRDYKKGIINNLFMPVWQYVGFGWKYERWKDTLKNAIENYVELECDKLSI